MQAAGVILAAGSSTRFGSPKQLARIGEVTMLETVVELARRAGLEPVIAVVPPGLAPPAGAVPVVNDEPQAGLSRSLRMGLSAVPAEVGAAVIMLGDQPTLAVETLRAILHDLGSGAIVAARADGRLGPPVLLMRESFGLADELEGDVGLGPLLASRPELVIPVEVGEHAPDIDTPADLKRLR